ncbi:Villin headpiece domain-containing protein [uncultured Prochlorococcus sp.]|uniref:Villin headpiece domain-containing protein n=1 Tax=uncultured Prochlorococcus sp. TaxID=159733 RepID=UPI00258CA796|nr:Villin headpiece domain-containing protein [uncultured Prochlorococcus sp.]
MNFLNVFKSLSIPFIFIAIIFNLNPKLSELRASNKLVPANEKDLDLYRSMGITYLCSTSDKGTDADFEKSLVVATNLFSTVMQQKHGGIIKEGKKKQQKIEARSLQNNIIFQLVGGALSYCPNNVPEVMEKEFRNQVKKIQESNKK